MTFMGWLVIKPELTIMCKVNFFKFLDKCGKVKNTVFNSSTSGVNERKIIPKLLVTVDPFTMSGLFYHSSSDWSISNSRVSG